MSPLLKRKKSPADDKYLLRKYCCMSAGLAMLVMVIIYIAHRNTLIVGGSTVLRMDLYHQYGPLYAEVYDRITGGNSLVYSWTSGLGASFLGNLFNYCCSPSVLFMLICGHKNMPEAIALMIMAKAVLASTAFTYYVNKSNNCVKKESVAFGLFYAFSGYFVAYSWNIMWFDAVAVFPLVMLGIERIINKNKPGLYIGMMTFTMVSNYYMAYMICILSVMYFLYFYFGRYELSSKIFKKTEAVSDTADCENVQTSAAENTEAPVAAECEAAVNEDAAVADAVAVNEVAVEAAAEETVSSQDVYTEYVEQIPEEAAQTHKKKQKRHKFRDNRFWVTGWTFALSSFLCFALAAFALLPVYYCLQTSSATAGEFPEEFKQYFDVFRFIANHLSGVEPTIRSSGDNVIPNVYCGLITVMLLPFYFLSDKIPGKQKVASAILLMACLAGFVVNHFNFVWHGFHMPNDLPYRWSFAYSFFLLMLAFKAFRNIREFSNKAYVGVGFAVMCFLVLAEKFEVPNVTLFTLIVSAVFTILYVVLFGMMRSTKYVQKTIVFLLFFTVILEIVVADVPRITMAQPKEAYTSDYDNYQVLSESVEADEEELFYRTELSKLRARMDPSWFGYNGVSVFSSMAYDHTSKTMEKLGLSGNNINSYTYFPQTPIFNSLFALKYVYDNENFINETSMYNFVEGNDDFEAYEYKYYLPLINSVSSDVTEWDYSSSDPFTVQNDLMYKATGVKDILIPAYATSFSGENVKDIDPSTINSGVTFTAYKNTNGTEGKAIVKLTPEADGNYYVYIGSTRLESLNIEAGEISYFYNSSSIEPFVLDVGYLTTADEIEITYNLASGNDYTNLAFSAARLDEAKFKEAYKKIKSNGTFNMTAFDETTFEGTIKVTNSDSFLWTSIPYDESWEITLDGNVLAYAEYDAETDEITTDGDIVKIGGGLIGIRAGKGEHTISFRYKAQGLSSGMMLTGMGICVLAIVFIYKKWLEKFFEKAGFVPLVFRKPDFEIE